jgi:hypothetical protein
VASTAPRPAQAQTLPLPQMLRGAAPITVAPSAGAVPATASPSVGLLGFLDGVFCTTRTRCWAVGGQAGAGGVSIANQVLRWNGTTWTAVRTPNPGGKGNGKVSELEDSTCVTSADCWAVGVLESLTNGIRDQILHWNGKKWSDVQLFLQA